MHVERAGRCSSICDTKTQTYSIIMGVMVLLISIHVKHSTVEKGEYNSEPMWKMYGNEENDKVYRADNLWAYQTSSTLTVRLSPLSWAVIYAPQKNWFEFGTRSVNYLPHAYSSQHNLWLRLSRTPLPMLTHQISDACQCVGGVRLVQHSSWKYHSCAVRRMQKNSAIKFKPSIRSWRCTVRIKCYRI